MQCESAPCAGYSGCNTIQNHTQRRECMKNNCFCDIGPEKKGSGIVATEAPICVTCVGPRPSVMVLDKNMPCHERSLHFLSVPDLVFYHGDRKHWWGDLSANETRILYHSLLPYYYPTYLKEYHPVDLARMVFEARRSARTYARRRSCFHVRCMSVLLDGIRNIVRHRKWKTKFDDVWNKHGHCWNDEQQIAMRVLNGSCHTNYWADRFCGTRRIEKMML